MNSSFFSQLVSTLFALTAVLTLAWFVLRAVRSRLPGMVSRGVGPADGPRFVRAIPVGQRERVVVVEHRGEQFMLGVTSGAVNLLARWPQDTPPPSVDAQP